jgi:hypothetical protein
MEQTTSPYNRPAFHDRLAWHALVLIPIDVKGGQQLRACLKRLPLMHRREYPWGSGPLRAAVMGAWPLGEEPSPAGGHIEEAFGGCRGASPEALPQTMPWCNLIERHEQKTIPEKRSNDIGYCERLCADPGNLWDGCGATFPPHPSR